MVVAILRPDRRDTMNRVRRHPVLVKDEVRSLKCRVIQSGAVLAKDPRIKRLGPSRVVPVNQILRELPHITKHAALVSEERREH